MAIRVNFTNLDGKRTSTTVNDTLALHYTYRYSPFNPLDKIDINKHISNCVQQFVNDNDKCTSKDIIESELLYAIERKPIEPMLTVTSRQKSELIFCILERQVKIGNRLTWREYQTEDERRNLQESIEILEDILKELKKK